MAEEWERVVRRPQDVCALCEEVFVSGQDLVTVLDLEDAGFARRDLHGECFERTEGAPFSVWRWRKARDLRPNARRLDLGFLTEFFKRLDGRDESQARRVHWIVSLLLLRKKIVEEVGRSTGEDGREILHLRIKHTEKVYEVADPALDGDAMLEIEGDLSRIFNLEPAPPEDGQETERGDVDA